MPMVTILYKPIKIPCSWEQLIEAVDNQEHSCLHIFTHGNKTSREVGCNSLVCIDCIYYSNNFKRYVSSVLAEDKLVEIVDYENAP